MHKLIITVISALIVAFGQPAWIPFFGILAAFCGFALFWSVIVQWPSGKKRFYAATGWFLFVQCVQLEWLLTHPYSYIYGVYFALALGIAVQFGLLGIFITPENLKKPIHLLGLAGLYTLFEWLRLFFLSGYSLNPVGLALTSTLTGMQLASVIGVYGLTFIVILTNLLALCWWLKLQRGILFAFIAIVPYVFGYFHLRLHQPFIEEAKENPKTTLSALLVQTAFPTEETMTFPSLNAYVAHVEGEWLEILKTLKPYLKKGLELVVLPEYVVPFGTYVPIYPYERVEKVFLNLFGEEGKKALPPLAEPLALEEENLWKVSNGYFALAIANLFHADLVIGLQDDQWVSEKDPKSYSSALYFWPESTMGLRYEKRVLLPMAEYIPFEFCRQMAAKYGISGSFTSGTEAKVFPGRKAPFGLSICYEETFGDLMRENKQKGAELLINLTSDVWYPNSRLPKQHFDHARLRTLESGIPLIRSCNTGITAAIDSVGNLIGSVPEEEEWVRQALFVKVPLYHYRTVYSSFGDSLMIGLSLLFIILSLCSKIAASSRW